MDELMDYFDDLENDHSIFLFWALLMDSNTHDSISTIFSLLIKDPPILSLIWTYKEQCGLNYSFSLL